MTLLLLGLLLATALHYLGSRARITRFLWSRYPAWLDGFMLCPACAGAWLAAGVFEALGLWLGRGPCGTPYQPVATGAIGLLAGCVGVPLGLAALLRALAWVESDHVPEDAENAAAPDSDG